MKSEIFCLITADSTHQIMKLEKLILQKNIKVRIIPVPKEITASCGLSIKFDFYLLEEIKLLLLENSSDFSLYTVEKSGLKKNVTRL